MIPRRLAALAATTIIGVMLATLAPAVALAAPQTSEPAVLNIGWWWEQAQSEEQDIQGNKFTVDTPSPFCPAVPGSLGVVPGGCAEGHFPVEIVGGDYEEPSMLSALGFDLSALLTPGSKVIKFTVTLLEGESGCRDKAGDGFDPQQGDYCQDVSPKGPVDERQVRACELPHIFGDAEGRPYKERPDYECSSGDPTATRKEIKAVDEDDADGVDHIWKFDLTEFASRWAESFTVATNVMLVGQKPKETDGQDSWRVVFAGPKVEKGIRTKLVYEPGEIVIAPPGSTFVPPGTSFTGTSGGATFGGGSTTTTFGGEEGTDPGAVAQPGVEPSPGAEPGTTPLAAEDLEPPGTPAYVWLALLAGLIAFSLVRQVVIESTTGVRPNGVLAKIHALNAERRLDDAAAAAEGPSPLAGLGAIGHSLSQAVIALKSKLPFTRRG